MMSRILSETEKEEFTIKEKDASNLILKLVFPISLMLFICYYAIWKHQFEIENIRHHVHGMSAVDLSLYCLYIVISILFGIVLHELLHGLTWVLCSNIGGFKSIKFGIIKETLTPYCHCKAPLKRNSYILGIIMPAIVLGLVPILIGLSIGNILIYFFGYIFILVAMGDFMITYYLLKHVSKSCSVQDHHSKIGFFIFKKV
ncbi:DUF3267 domain-containing protein [Sphingobacterium sp. PCS056]|uniref:DUF3267 domain-containing protein n=1 Tax=Sphingobacterium sp. PCS056 TaxID=2931400 RepID=UPI00200F1601|nr:DUF3267 domain-containing protein [Sphingobacterium sp. PCS056]UPZ34634.1 DUF3267 domain-containing protein [Sphingobacterium sp. PCS056]